MSRYVLTPPARDDLREIREYIRLDNPDAALRVVDDLRRRCRALARRPYIGHTRTDLLPEESSTQGRVPGWRQQPSTRQSHGQRVSKVRPCLRDSHSQGLSTRDPAVPQ